MKIKIQPDGQILLERQGGSVDEAQYEALLNLVKDKDKLRNFLFQWKDRKILLGQADLCG